MKIDLLAIGDPVIDCFIRLKDAKVHCNIDHEECELCVKFGQKIPFEFAVEVPAVGNAANAATACARLGLSAAFRGSVGADPRGALIIDTFKKNGVITDYVLVEEGKTTNYHYVLWYESERTILVKHEHFTYSVPQLPEPPRWVYLSSLGEGTERFQREVASYATASGAKLAFQPGTFQIQLGVEALREVYASTEIFFCNKEEARTILGTKEANEKRLMEEIRALGPRIVVVTDGRNGSYILDDAGAWHAPIYPDPKPPVERTGAGDATAATTVAYMQKGLPPHEALLRGLINSAYVVQEIGAQKGLLTSEQIEMLYQKRPADFILTRI